MPRKARILLPHTPHHIVQRGHNRATVFAAKGDYAYYLDTLIEWKRKLAIKVYAYCLMTNHVHLIVEPEDDVATVGQLMRRLAGRQTRLVNSLEARTGTLWSGRYRASPIQRDNYLLACLRYVELNPVRAAMVEAPKDYHWSSHRLRLASAWPDWLDEHECYRSLGNTPGKRFSGYRDYVRSESHSGQYKVIRDAVNRNQLTGDHAFIKEVENRIGRRIELRGRGRPSTSEK